MDAEGLLGGAPPGAPARRAVAGFFACWFAACALHMMAVFAGVAYGVFLLLQLRRRPPVFLDHALVWLGAAPFFAALGLYFARFAFGAPELGFPTSPLSGIVQIAYYFAGLGGLGWARNSFREMSIGFSPRAAAELAAAVLAYAAFFACCLRARVWRNRRTIAAIACTAAALLVFLAANIALKTRFWERHVIYLVPGLLFARTSGRTRLLLFDRAEYDPAGFHPVLSGLDRHVTGFSVVDAADIPAAALSPESNPMWAGRTHVPTGKWPVFPPAEAAR